MATPVTLLYTWFCGKKTGEDVFGNRYFESKCAPREGRRKRWVVYKGISEASKVPPEWHRWLHYTTDEIPETMAKHYEWEKPHLPNLTGTDLAYRPPGHLLKSGKRAKASADYIPWNP